MHFRNGLPADGVPLNSEGVRVSEVELCYLPDRPETEIVVGGTSDDGGMEWLGGILVLLGGFGVYRLFLRKAASNAAQPD